MPRIDRLATGGELPLTEDTMPPPRDGLKPRTNVRVRAQDDYKSVEVKTRETKRQCRARVSLPSRDGKTLVSFECTERAGHASAGALSGHSETGRVRLRNNHVYEYSIFWNEVEIEEIWRIEAEPNKDRIATQAELDRVFGDGEAERKHAYQEHTEV